jgi:hypothetical protein
MYIFIPKLGEMDKTEIEKLKSAMVEKLVDLSNDNPKFVRPYMRKLVDIEFGRDHRKCISDIRKNWRRHRTSRVSDDDWCGENTDQEEDCILGSDAVSNHMRRQDIRWRENLYYDLKTYLIQQDHPDITQYNARRYAEDSLSAMVEATKEVDTKEHYVTRAIDSMDREIKFRLFKWFYDKGLAYMYNPCSPYENVANYVILNEYDISNWNIILPLLGKTHVNSFSGGHNDQQTNLLTVLERMGKNSSYHALTKKRGGKIKKPKSTARSKVRSITKHKLKSKKNDHS